MCEIHRAAHAFGCIIPNEADIEITNCRLAEIESEWHRATRPSKLFQEANYNEQGDVTNTSFPVFPRRCFLVYCSWKCEHKSQ